MMRYSVQPRDRTFVSDYGFLSFVGNMDKNLDENISKNLSSKYNQILLNQATQSCKDAHSKKQFKKQQTQLVI